MKSGLGGIVAVALCMAFPARDQANAGPAGNAREDYAAFIHEQRLSVGLPALASGVANRSGILAIAIDGDREAGKGGPARSDDLWHLGSITKSMTATMIARLVDAGVLRWTTTPGQLWPEQAASMDPALRDATLETILRHQAGIDPYETDEQAAGIPRFRGDPRQQREAFALWLTRQPPTLPQGRYSYSNAGYGLAGAMAEKAAGQSWDRLLQRELFEPLGMRHCVIGWPADGRPGQPRGHRAVEGKFVPHDLADGYRLAPWIQPAGDVSCSIRDVLAYGQAHILGEDGAQPLLEQATWYKLHDAPAGSYALGWNVHPWGFAHLGSAETFVASLVISPSRDIVAFTVTNAAGWPDDNDLFSTVASRAFRQFALPAEPSEE